MEYVQLIKEHFPIIFKRIKNNILNEPEIFHFVENKDVLEAFLDKQEKLVTTYFLNYPNIDENNLAQISKFYTELKIPYVLILKNIEVLKVEFIKELSKTEHKFSIDFVLEIREHFQKLENIIAKAYLTSDISQLKDAKNTVFSKYLLYSAYLSFIEMIIESTKNENFENFPFLPLKETDFYKYITYPESLMICINTTLYNHMEHLYKTIHKLAYSFYTLYTKGEYVEAYLIFKELKDNSLKLSKLLAEMYFVVFSNVEEYFFKLVEELGEWNKRRYVFLIDIKNLKYLNKVHSEIEINRILKVIEEKLRNFVKDKRDKLLLIKGSTANFFLLAVDFEEKEIKDLAYFFKELINGKYILDKEHVVDIDVSVAVVEIEKYADNSKIELMRILFYLKDQAKFNNGVAFAISELEKQALKNWLNKNYRNISFIKNKILAREVEVVFQPIVNTKTKEIIHLETLARIRDSEKLVSPGIFLDLLYELDLMKNLDFIVLDKILEKKEKIKGVSTSIFINVSSGSFSQKDFLDHLKFFIKNMKNFNVTFEITEQELIKDVEVLSELKEEFPKIRFAIDDFGTGYSSLKLVANLAENKILHILKIDKSLISNLSDKTFTQKVVRAISLLSKSLGIQTVAEFVEDEETWNIIKELNIDFTQGYYISKPETIEELIISQLEKV